MGETTGIGDSDSGSSIVKEMRHAAVVTREKAWDYNFNQFSSTVSSFINDSSSGSSSRDGDGVELRDASPVRQSMNSSSSNVGIVRMRNRNNRNSNIHSLYSDDD